MARARPAVNVLPPVRAAKRRNAYVLYPDLIAQQIGTEVSAGHDLSVITYRFPNGWSARVEWKVAKGRARVLSASAYYPVSAGIQRLHIVRPDDPKARLLDVVRHDLDRVRRLPRANAAAESLRRRRARSELS